MRYTETTGKASLNSMRAQDTLDQLWNLIEDKYDEEWRVDSNGEVLLVVDDVLLERIIADNPNITAWTNYPLGTFIIKGIYAPDLSYIPGDYTKREYFFVQEGF